MPQVDFTAYQYYPALQSTVGEHMGYSELSNDAKDAILPVFELSQRGNAANLEVSLAAIRESSGRRPFLLDLNHDAAPAPYVAANPRDPEADRLRVERETAAQEGYNEALAELLDPTDGFAGWRECVAQYPNAIPVLQFTDATTQSRQILRQAALLAAGDNSIAMRIHPEGSENLPDIVASIISVLSSPDQLLVILDCAQGRTLLEGRAAFASDTISAISARLDVVERPLLRAVCMSNSFTNSNHDGLRDYENLDWRLWRDATESFPFAFGDYGAMFRRRRQNTFVPPDSRAAVVCPLDEMWLYFRSENANDRQGWIDGARAIVGRREFASVPRCWGRALIERAAAGDIAGVDSARFWYAAKVNIHLTTQATYAQANAAGGDNGGDE